MLLYGSKVQQDQQLSSQDLSLFLPFGFRFGSQNRGARGAMEKEKVKDVAIGCSGGEGKVGEGRGRGSSGGDQRKGDAGEEDKESGE